MTNEEFMSLPIAEREVLGKLLDHLDQRERVALQHEKFEALLILSGYKEGAVAYYPSDYEGMPQAMAAVALRREQWKDKVKHDE